jgi:hypothetical protein
MDDVPKFTTIRDFVLSMEQLNISSKQIWILVEIAFSQQAISSKPMPEILAELYKEQADRIEIDECIGALDGMDDKDSGD